MPKPSSKDKTVKSGNDTDDAVGAPESTSRQLEKPTSTPVTQTEDGTWHAAINVNVQVSHTWERGNPPGPITRKPSGGDTNTGGTTKTGLGVEKKSGS